MAEGDSELVEAARGRLRDMVTRAVNAFVALDATAEQMDGWTAILEGFVERIEADPPGSVLWGINPRGIFGMSGVRSKLLIQATAPDGEERATGVVTFGREHEGHKGFAHGGVTASLFDDFFGTLWGAGGQTQPMVTEELSVRYRALAPIGRQLQLEARSEPANNGRFACSGRLFDAGTVYAEASGVFVGTRRALAGQA